MEHYVLQPFPVFISVIDIKKAIACLLFGGSRKRYDFYLIFVVLVYTCSLLDFQMDFVVVEILICFYWEILVQQKVNF